MSRTEPAESPLTPENGQPRTSLPTQERLALGRARRKQMKRIHHADWTARLRKRDPLALLKSSTKGRIPSLVALKNERMACSPFAYFRGALPVMAYDLSLIPNTGLLTQLCGDAHVRNLGAYAGPDGRLVFDINDFDETLLGPFDWEVKRMATSLILAGREAHITDAHAREAAAAFLANYRRLMHLFTTMPILDVARYQVHRLSDYGPVSAILLAAKRSTPLASLATLTEPIPAHPRLRTFRNDPPVLTRISGEEAASVIASLLPYAETLQPERRHFLSHYRVVDVAFKVVGTGSVGLRDYCIYLEGNGRKDPLFLQIKEEAISAWSPYVKRDALKNYHQGRRVVEGERAMQLQSDPFLGWTKIPASESHSLAKNGKSRDYMVRQLNDHKGTLDLTSLKPSGLMEYASVCGELLARGHARGGDCALLAGYIGNSERFDQAILEFATLYANQTEKDHAQLVKSLKSKGKRGSVVRSRRCPFLLSSRMK